MNPVHESASCAVAACAEIIGAKWTALLVHDLSEGPRRFSELERSCAGISPRTLSERLRALEDEAIVERRSYPESPPRVEYELTGKGQGVGDLTRMLENLGMSDHANEAAQHQIRHPVRCVSVYQPLEPIAVALVVPCVLSMG